MIRRILTVALREFKEHSRQPWMIFTMSSLLMLIIIGVMSTLWMLNGVVGQPIGRAVLEGNLRQFGLDVGLEGVVSLVIETFHFLCFSQLLGMTAVLAGHSVIHDRQCQTLPFLLLAPLRRGELLAGKVLGAILMPLLLYVGLGGTAAMAISTWEVAAPFANKLPFSGGWVVAFFFGGPLWALFVGTVCAIMSSLARDVRTAQQAAWFFVFFSTLAFGLPLGMMITFGAVFQLIVAAGGLGAFLTAVILGSLVISRDLGR